MQCDAAEAEQHVAGVDRLGDAMESPQRGSMAPLEVMVLDVVVDEAEVVAELDGGRAGQRPLVLARDRGVCQQPEERPHPLAGRPRAIEPEVVTAHLVDAGGGRVVVLDQPKDLGLRVGDELDDVGTGGKGHRRHCR